MTLSPIDGLEPSRLENSSISLTDPRPRHHPCDVVERALASSHGLKMPLESSGLFNLGDPDLSSCVPASDVIVKTESDQLLTVDVSELFPELMGLNEEMSSDNLKPTIAVNALNLGSVSEMTSDTEVSPAETEASLDHFFNTFTDLTGFLENFSAETGPSDLADNSAVLAGNDNTTNDTTTTPSVGNLCPSPDDTETEPDEPPAKRACESTSKAPTRTRQTYRERRDKNNVASRRSRANRRTKFSGMEQRAVDLESENEHLKKKIEELEKIAEMSRKCLVEALSAK